jgi:hypothetical protein
VVALEDRDLDASSVLLKFRTSMSMIYLKENLMCGRLILMKFSFTEFLYLLGLH